MGNNSIDDYVCVSFSQNKLKAFPDPENPGAKPLGTPELPFLTTC
jgi:hypothetical protein